MRKLINVKIHTQSIVYPITFKPHILLDKIILFLILVFIPDIFSSLRYSTLKFVYTLQNPASTIT